MNGVRPVILGFLSRRPMSGYDVKATVDRSTRFFWAASYGQIYPELRRLEEEGLIVGESTPTGGRARTVYRLTNDGRGQLGQWLDEPDAGYEFRDLGLLKLFFSDGLDDPGRTLDVLRRMRADRERVLERLLAVREGMPEHVRQTSALLALEYGIDMHRWLVDWCDTTETRLLANREPADGGQTP